MELFLLALKNAATAPRARGTGAQMVHGAYQAAWWTAKGRVRPSTAARERLARMGTGRRVGPPAAAGARTRAWPSRVDARRRRPGGTLARRGRKHIESTTGGVVVAFTRKRRRTLGALGRYRIPNSLKHSPLDAPLVVPRVHSGRCGIPCGGEPPQTPPCRMACVQRPAGWARDGATVPTAARHAECVAVAGLAALCCAARTCSAPLG